MCTVDRGAYPEADDTVVQTVRNRSISGMGAKAYFAIEFKSSEGS